MVTRDLLTGLATILCITTSDAGAQQQTFPLGATDPSNRVEFVVRWNNRNYYSETGINGNMFDIMYSQNGYQAVIVAEVNCDTQQYRSVATAYGFTSDDMNATVAWFGTSRWFPIDVLQKNAGDNFMPGNIKAKAVCNTKRILGK